MCKNLEYISLLQSRAMLAEPSKMHRNRPLAVHPATVVGKVVVIANIVALRVFVLFALQGFYTRDSRSLIAFKD
jgi:hypothetical protein